MGDLIFLLHQIQLFLYGWIVFVAILSNLKQDFNHILDSLIDICFVKNASKLVENRQGDWTAHLFQVLSNLTSQTNCDFDAIIGGLV
jgi:hypothetical protein